MKRPSASDRLKTPTRKSSAATPSTSGSVFKRPAKHEATITPVKTEEINKKSPNSLSKDAEILPEEEEEEQPTFDPVEDQEDEEPPPVMKKPSLRHRPASCSRKPAAAIPASTSSTTETALPSKDKEKKDSEKTDNKKRASSSLQSEEKNSDGWTVQKFVRNEGTAHAGGIYKKFISPSGKSYYSKTKAQDDGYVSDVN